MRLALRVAGAVGGRCDDGFGLRKQAQGFVRQEPLASVGMAG